MQSFVTSRYLRTLRRPDGHAVYHSLFGGLALLDDQALAVLRSFDVPGSLSAGDDARRGWMLDEFRARAFLVPDAFDERAVLDEEVEARLATCADGRLVRALQLVVSNECNFRCKYCFVKTMWSSPERTELQAAPSNRRMSTDVAFQAMDASLELARRHPRDALYVEFFGGEPLTNWPVVEAVLQRYGAVFDGTAIRYSITTNGSLVDDHIARVLRDHDVTVALSFDSPASTDRVSPHLARRSARELLEGKIRALRRAGCGVNFNSVLSKDTVSHFDGRALVDYALEHGVRMVGLILDLDLDFYAREDLKRLAAEEVLSTYHYGHSCGLPIVGYWYQTFAQLAGHQGINLQTGYKTCPAEGCKLSVEPDGHLFICKCCATPLGHITKLDEALAGDAYRAYVRKGFQNAPECAGCEIEGTCSGVCMGALEERYGGLDVIEPAACDLFREITRRLVTEVSPDRIEHLTLAGADAA